MNDTAPPQPPEAVTAPKRRRKGLHVPLPAVLVGLGVVSGPIAAQPVSMVRPDFFSVPRDAINAFLPVLANDTLPNASASFFAAGPAPIGNVAAQFGGFRYTPPPGFTGPTSFAYCVVGIPPANACATVSLLVVGPQVPVPALSVAALAGLSGMLGWLGMRGRRRR